VTGLALPSLSGALTGSGTNVSGVLHADATTGCATSNDAIPVSGSTDAKGVTTMSGGVAGGTLVVTGSLAADGQSLTDATYNVTGGQCAFPQAAAATIQNYDALGGTYTGTLNDAASKTINLTASITQADTADSYGNFDLSGTGNFGSSACFTSPVTMVNSLVSGGGFVVTYTDTTKGNSLTATGTLSTDGKTLTVTSWTLTGPCGADSGTGSLTQ
jgi:hypothetical protein